MFTYFIRADGSPGYSFFLAVAGGAANIVLDYLFIARMGMGVFGAGLATILGLVLSFSLGILYFLKYKKHLQPVWKNLQLKVGLKCALNDSSEFIDQLAIAITTVVFNRTALSLAGENGIAAVSIIMYLHFLFIGVYFLALSGMRLYGIGYLFSGLNIFTAIRLTAYGKGHLSAVITFLRSFFLLLLFLLLLPIIWGMNGMWLAMPIAEAITTFLCYKTRSAPPQRR